MNKKKLQKLSVAALIVSILPLATFVPMVFNMTLTEQVRTVWSVVNVFSVIFGLLLSIICVKDHESRSMINILSTVVSGFWLLLMGGIAGLAVLLNYLK